MEGNNNGLESSLARQKTGLRMPQEVIFAPNLYSFDLCHSFGMPITWYIILVESPYAILRWSSTEIFIDSPQSHSTQRIFVLKSTNLKATTERVMRFISKLLFGNSSLIFIWMLSAIKTGPELEDYSFHIFENRRVHFIKGQ